MFVYTDVLPTARRRFFEGGLNEQGAGRQSFERRSSRHHTQLFLYQSVVMTRDHLLESDIFSVAVVSVARLKCASLTYDRTYTPCMGNHKLIIVRKQCCRKELMV